MNKKQKKKVIVIRRDTIIETTH